MAASPREGWPPERARRWAFDSGSTRSATARPRAAGTRPKRASKEVMPGRPARINQPLRFLALRPRRCWMALQLEFTHAAVLDRGPAHPGPHQCTGIKVLRLRVEQQLDQLDHATVAHSQGIDFT